MCEHVRACASECKRVRACASVCERVQACARVCECVRECASVCECVQACASAAWLVTGISKLVTSCMVLRSTSDNQHSIPMETYFPTVH